MKAVIRSGNLEFFIDFTINTGPNEPRTIEIDSIILQEFPTNYDMQNDLHPKLVDSLVEKINIFVSRM